MINFIIYEDEQKVRDMYISTILKIVGSKNDAYKITQIESYTQDTLKEVNNLVGKKIYIMDVEVPGKSGLDFAREIRNSGDWLSQIIVVTAHDKMVNYSFRSKMLMLDFISKYYECEENLREALKLAYQIVTIHKSLKIQHNGEIYQIPYNDILYIEKNLDDLNSKVVTKDNELEFKQSISGIMEFLKDDPRFLKTHRSCIVNLYNITKADLNTNEIFFDEKKTNLLSRDKRKELKEKLSSKLVRL